MSVAHYNSAFLLKLKLSLSLSSAALLPRCPEQELVEDRGTLEDFVGARSLGRPSRCFFVRCFAVSGRMSRWLGHDVFLRGRMRRKKEPDASSWFYLDGAKARKLGFASMWVFRVGLLDLKMIKMLNVAVPG